MSEPIHPESRANICTITYLAALAVMLFVLALLLGSCDTSKRLQIIKAKHPRAAAKFCAEEYPIVEKVSVRVDTVTTYELVPGVPVYLDCDSAIKYRTDTNKVLVRVPCPDQQLITHWVTKDSIVTQMSTAALDTANRASAVWRGKYEAVKTTRDRLWWAAGIGWALILGSVAWKFFGGRMRLISGARNTG